MTAKRRWGVGALAFGIATLFESRDASAETPAQALFDEGKMLAQAGRWVDACPKFEQSETLEPNMVTLYSLAYCYEHTGRLASAWTHFVEAGTLAKAAGSAQRYTDAMTRADALRPRLGHVRITVEQPTKDERVLVDGTPIAKELWGTDIPTDAGGHTIEVQAPRKVAITRSITVVDGERAPLTLPVLADAAVHGEVRFYRVYPTTQTSEQWSTVKTTGVTIAAIGAIAMGTSVAFGVVAKNKDDHAAEECNPACSTRGKNLNADARSLGNIGTGIFVAGAALLTTGVVLWLLGGNRREPTRTALAWRF